MRRVYAVELGWLLWRVSQVATLLHHEAISSTLRYDDNESDTHQFFAAVLQRNADPADVVDAWKDAVLVLPDGSTEAMDPAAIMQFMMSERQKVAA